MGWYEAAVLAVLASLALLLWRLLHPAPLLVIDDRGILDRRSRLGWIRWDEIEGAYRSRAPETETLCLRVRLSDRLRRRLSRRGREVSADGAVVVPLRLAGTDVTEVEVLQEILFRRGAATTAHDPQPARG